MTFIFHIKHRVFIYSVYIIYVHLLILKACVSRVSEVQNYFG